jgi:hypothetical protein
MEIQIKLCSRIYNMNSIENLKSAQFRKLFKIFKSSNMESLNIFGITEGFLSEFACLHRVWKFENLFY